MPLLSRLTYFGLAKETTIGTPVAPSLFVPATKIQPEDMPTYLDDDSLYGQPTKVRGVYQGVKDSVFDFDGFFYPEVIGSLMVAMGLADTVTPARSVADAVTTISTATVTSATAAFTVADVGASISGPTSIPAGAVIAAWVNGTTVTMSVNATASQTAQALAIGTASTQHHRFAIPASGAQPPTYTMTDFDAVEARAYPGQILDAFDVTIDAKGAIKYTAKFKGWTSVTASTPAPAFPASASLLGYETTAAVGGVACNRIISASLSVKRAAQTIHTALGTQNPYTSWAGPIEATLKLKTLFESNVELNHILTNDQPTTVMTITAPGGGTAPVFTLINTKGAWRKAKIDRSPEFVQLDSEVTCVYNAADGGPFQASLTNVTATAY